MNTKYRDNKKPLLTWISTGAILEQFGGHLNMETSVYHNVSHVNIKSPNRQIHDSMAFSVAVNQKSRIAKSWLCVAATKSLDSHLWQLRAIKDNRTRKGGEDEYLNHCLEHGLICRDSIKGKKLSCV